MAHDFSGKLALVTGASRGIGAAVAKALAHHGAHVILLARTQGALEEVDDAIRADGNGKATLIPMDLGKLDDVDKLGPSIRERFEKLDIFFGNAGMLGPLTPAHQIDPKDWQKVMTVNFFANIHLVRTLDPLLRAADEARVVFNTAGEYAENGMAYWSPYMASKAALNSFAKTYALETRRTNMKVNMLYPGATDTKLMNEAFSGKTKMKMKDPQDIVPHVLDLMNADCENHGERVVVKDTASAQKKSA
ncbi:MAG: SDR family NAD(P)-dependent oxidoreductase [Pseudomonadota bacterium]